MIPSQMFKAKPPEYASDGGWKSRNFTVKSVSGWPEVTSSVVLMWLVTTRSSTGGLVSNTYKSLRWRSGTRAVSGAKVKKGLSGEPLILLGKGRASREQIDQVFREEGASMNIEVETHTVGSACGFARSGVGIAIVNEMLSARYSGPGLVIRRFGPNFVHEYAFMRSRETPMTRVTDRFLQHCRSRMRAR